MDTMDPLHGLNDQQKVAVMTTSGPVLILAGAGSGKTKALTHRIAYLITVDKVYPTNILAVTFTNKAAEEMRQRVARLLVPNPPSAIRHPPNFVLPWLGTFHAVCARLLRQSVEQSNLRYDRHYTILDEEEALSVIKQAMEKVGADPTRSHPKAVAEAISSAKNELIGPDRYPEYAEGRFQAVVSLVYPEYQLLLRSLNAMDFDDLLFNTVRLFDTEPEILSRYQKLFHHILIDEYQDTNTVQYQVTKLLAAIHQNICVVGDDYQAIYGWRGANFQNILNFERDYPGATIIKLEQSYRSTKHILSVAQTVIAHNRLRTEKKLWTANEKGVPVMVVECKDEIDEAQFISNEIQSLHRAMDWRLSEFVILYRTNAQSRAIEEVLLQAGLPYRIIGGFRFYERQEIKDLLAYLRLLVNPHDWLSLTRAAKVPPRGIGDKAIADWRAGRPSAKIEQFLTLINDWRQELVGQTPDQMTEQVFVRSGYKDWLTDESGGQLSTARQSRLENVKELIGVASTTASLEEFLERVALVQEVDNYDPGADGIILMTVHNSKGLEFPVVFIAGMEEGIFPHSRNVTDELELEEERRLCYVGMTRAINRLYLLYTRRRRLWGNRQFNIPSRFLEEIPHELVEKISPQEIF